MRVKGSGGVGRGFVKNNEIAKITASERAEFYLNP